MMMMTRVMIMMIKMMSIVMIRHVMINVSIALEISALNANRIFTLKEVIANLAQNYVLIAQLQLDALNVKLDFTLIMAHVALVK
jgi:hypothetical protein